jgi:hypothetical protein
MSAPDLLLEPAEKHNWLRRGRVGIALGMVMLIVFAVLARPTAVPGRIPGPTPDAPDYAYMAAALLHGSYLVDYDGSLHATRYTPGFPVLLMPAVALGGVEAAVWVPFICALALGVLLILVAVKLAGGTAAPLAVLLTMFTPLTFYSAQMVMSDLPATTLVLGQVALLALGSGGRSGVLAGLLAGSLAWLRPASLVLVAAGLSGQSASSRSGTRAIGYVIASGVGVVLLALWQWSTFGSPLLTSYQANGASPDGSTGLQNFFSLSYIWTPPWNAYSQGPGPNGLVYPAQLVGIDSAAGLPLIGLLGLAGAVVLARSPGAAGCVGRFSLATNALTLLVYVPYFFREERFLMTPVVLNEMIAAVLLARLLSWIRSMLVLKRAASVVPTEPSSA